MAKANYRIGSYRGKPVIIPLDSIDGYKGAASNLACFLNCPYSMRGYGYLASPRKVQRFKWLVDNGYHAGIFYLYDSAHNKVDDPTASRKWRPEFTIQQAMDNQPTREPI